jgi:hypothetical protein
VGNLDVRPDVFNAPLGEEDLLILTSGAAEPINNPRVD